MQRNTKAEAKNGGVRTESLAKGPTGITGLDEITQGGLPKGRPRTRQDAVGYGVPYSGHAQSGCTVS